MDEPNHHRASLAERIRRKARRFALSELPATEGLDITSFADVLLAYGNWKFRQINAVPRQVFVSKELTASWPYPDELAEISRRLEAGEDVSPFLSKKTSVAFDASSPEKNGSRQDRDLLLAEWGIHHLHLSLKPGSDSRYARTRDLLFAIVTDERAFLINVYPHGSWTKRELISIAARNWPDEELIPASRVAIGLTQEFTEEEHQELRNSGVSVAVFVDGMAYLGLGQTMDGSPMPVAQHLMDLQHSIDNAATNLPADLDGQLAYWVPEIRKQEVGVASGGRFHSLGALPGTFRGP